MVKDIFSPEGKAQQRKLFGIALGVMALTWAIGVHYSMKKDKKDFITFNSAAISGRMKAITKMKIGVRLRVKEDEFIFYPIANERLNGYKSFTDLAGIGDSIVKAAYSDTLVLFTKNKAYSYTFKKY